jgi:hypothetical protein
MKRTQLLPIGSVVIAATAVVVDGIRHDGTPGPLTVLFLDEEAVPADFIHSHRELDPAEALHEMDFVIESRSSPPTCTYLTSRPL